MKKKEIDLQVIKDVRQREILQNIIETEESGKKLIEDSRKGIKDSKRLVEFLEDLSQGLEDDEYHPNLRKKAARVFADISSQLKGIQIHQGYHNYIISKIKKIMMIILGNYRSEDPDLVLSAITSINHLFEKPDTEIILPLLENILVEVKDELDILYNAASILWRESISKPLELFTTIYLDNLYPEKFHSYVFVNARGYITKTKNWNYIEKIIAQAIYSKDREIRIKALKLFKNYGNKGLCEKDIQEALQQEDNEEIIIEIIYALSTVGTLKSLKILRDKREYGSPKISNVADEALQEIAKREGGFKSDAELIKALQPQRRSWVEHLRSIAVIISLFGFFVNIYFNVNPITDVKTWHQILQWFILGISVIFLLFYFVSSLVYYFRFKNFKKRMEYN